MNVLKMYRMLIVAMVMVLFWGQVAIAETFNLFGKELNMFGYLSQSFQYSLRSDHYDTEQDLNSALSNAFLEGQYSLTDELALYSAGQITVDWIYDWKRHDNSWNDKLFTDSRNKLYYDDHYWQLLKELHFTWTPGNFFFRVGKQIVAWGEMLGFRLLDQINPWDQRRGFIDVEFDSTIIPIWLARAEYYLPCTPTWVQDLGVEFTFNPNADFIPDQGIPTGNDRGGIWAPDITIPNPLPPFFFPGVTTARIGAGITDIEEREEWDSDGTEYGIRLKGLVWGAYVTLNYFYGYDNSPVTTNIPPGPNSTPPRLASDGTVILGGDVTGFYRRLRLLGFSVARDIERLRVDALGGIAPLWRIEAFYAFDSAFATQNPANPQFAESFEKHDDVRYAISVDWKVWIKWLNPRHSFSIAPTFYHRIIRDYPHGYGLKEGTGQGVEDDNYIYNIMISTSYFHEKIIPSVFWLRDQTNSADMIRLQLTYDRNDNWRYTIGAFLLDGREENKGFDVFENKDYMYFKIQYRWG